MYDSVMGMEKDAKMQENKGEIKDTGTIYELSYILLPTLTQEEVSAETGALTSLVTSLGGEIIVEENPTRIDLAYQMTKVVQTLRHKVDSGFFGWMKFEITSSEIEKIKKSCDASPVIVRYLILKTVRENTFIGGKIASKKDILNDQKVEDVIEDGSPETSSAVEIDKSIDDLVIA